MGFDIHTPGSASTCQARGTAGEKEARNTDTGEFRDAGPRTRGEERESTMGGRAIAEAEGDGGHASAGQSLISASS